MALTRVQELLPALGWAEHYRHRLFQDSVADWVRAERGGPTGLFWDSRESQSKEQAGTKTKQFRAVHMGLTCSPGCPAAPGWPLCPCGMKNWHQAIGFVVVIGNTLPT